MRLSVAVAVLVLSLATSVAAQTDAPPSSEPPATRPEPAVDAKTEARKDEGIICRREIPTGSLFAVKVCTTAEQRKAQSGAARGAQGAMQGGSQVVPH